MKDKIDIIIVVFFSLFVAFSAGALCARSVYQKQAIENNVAYYHPETAQFTWKTNLVEINNK